ncbi:MAG: electron transport complex subunit RsxC [Candidatus Marinimicrobia bacterium]|nr:electron transport complex subunit RsxC [Candidatus Neomarinimicrobiota bacterium]
MKLLTFRKGVHPKEFKELTEHKKIERFPTPREVFIPLFQHVGSPAKPIVEKGMDVKKGQVIGESSGFISGYIHASITGKVKTVDTFLHPLGYSDKMVHIVATEEGESKVIEEKRDLDKLSGDDIVSIIEKAGIVGLGGAAFPTHVKLSPTRNKKIDTFILNGCECEPYLTTDYRMMIEFPEKIIKGIQIIMKALGIRKSYIGIENNKLEAIQIINGYIKDYDNIEVSVLKTKYPQGAEKMLIKAILNREVPAGGLPMDVGVIVNNVGTVAAIHDAVVYGKPLIERVVTITGDGIKEPKNLLIPIGTLVKDVIEYCGGLTGNKIKVIMGGPMMGIALGSLDVPIIKGTSGILCLKDDKGFVEKVYPCIQCGNCVSVCPMFLIPTRIAHFSKKALYKEANDYGILNCIECGSCSYVCPSHIPLVQYIKIGKFMVNRLNKKE